MNDKYISIITNFGCHYTCPYCIVKNNNLDIPKTTIDGLDSLWLEIARNENLMNMLDRKKERQEITG